MINTIFGIKGDMTTRFDSLGRRVGVTQIKAEPSIIIDKKEGKVIIGFGKSKKVKKPQNHFVTALGFMPRYIKEIKTQKAEDLKNGDQVTVSVFQKQDLVKISGTTKGRGFAGGIKRWGFHGGPKTHGQSDRHRAPGSIGQTTTPGRVFKGKHMAGHYGAAKQTTTNIEVFNVDHSTNIIEVIGAVPGHKNGIVILEKTGKAKAYQAPPEEKPKEEEEEGKETKEPKEPEVPKQDKEEEK